MKSRRNAVAFPCHFAAIGLPSRGRPWRGRASAAARDLKNVVKQCFRVSSGEKRAPARLSQENKGNALVCSVLRGVWTLHEAQRAELGVVARNLRGTGHHEPACEAGRSPSLSPSMIHRLRLSLPLCAALLMPLPALCDGWSSLGGFDPDEAARMRDRLTKVSAPRPGGWGAFGTSDDWATLDRFERNTPGKTPPRLSAFRLPTGSQVRQLQALVAFAEFPRRAMTPSITVPPACPRNLRPG